MRRLERERRYQAVLDSIARLEYELGLSDVPPPRRGGAPHVFLSAASAAARWNAAANAKSANYSTGISGARAQAGATERERP